MRAMAIQDDFRADVLVDHLPDESEAEFHLAVAIETGFVLLCRFDPDITNVPFQAVLISSAV